MDSARITTLLEPFVPPASLCAEQVEALSKYLSLLQRWNARTNLTAIRDEENIVVRHFGESLFAASRLLRAVAEGKGGALSANIPEEQRCNTAELSSSEVSRTEEETLSVIDIGSGAGFPGVPLKIYSPQISLTLIESQNKKATFLKEVIRALSLSDAKVFVGRAETYTGRADLVTFRAVEHFERVLPIAASLLRPTELFSAESALPNLGSPTIAPSPRLALLIGATQQQVAERVLANFDWQRPMPLPVSSGRILLVGSPKQ